MLTTSPRHPIYLTCSHIWDTLRSCGDQDYLEMLAKFMGRARKNVPKAVTKKTSEIKYWKTYQQVKIQVNKRKNVWVWFTNFLFLLFWTTSRYSSICWTSIIDVFSWMKFCTVRNGSRLTPFHLVDLLCFWPWRNAWLAGHVLQMPSFGLPDFQDFTNFTSSDDGFHIQLISN